jgi:hypothetical protein
MSVPTSEVGYTLATTGRGDHEVHKGYVVALEKKKKIFYDYIINSTDNLSMWFLQTTEISNHKIKLEL